MRELFTPPINTESLDSWAKNLDDIARVAILAITMLAYSSNELGFKLINILFLAISVYLSLFGANFIRENKEALSKGGTK